MGRYHDYAEHVLTATQTTQVLLALSQQNAVLPQDVPAPDASAKTGILPRPSSKIRLLENSSYSASHTEVKRPECVEVEPFVSMEFQICMCGMVIKYKAECRSVLRSS